MQHLIRTADFTTEEILEYNLMSKSKLKGTLTRFTSSSDDKY